VGVAGPSNVLGRSSILHPQHSFSNHFSSMCSNDVDTKDLVSLFVSEHLDEALSVIVGSCPAVSLEQKVAFTIVNSFFFEVLLRFTHIGHLWVCVDHRRNDVVVHMTTIPNHVLYSSDPFFFSLVSKHHSLHNISNAINVAVLSLEVVIDFNLAKLVSLEASLLQLEPVSDGPPSSTHQQDITLNLLLLASS